MSNDAFYTSGEIATALDEKAWVVRHILNTRDIPPRRRFGITRIYGPEALEAVQRELKVRRERDLVTESGRPAVS